MTMELSSSLRSSLMSDALEKMTVYVREFSRPHPIPILGFREVFDYGTRRNVLLEDSDIEELRIVAYHWFFQYAEIDVSERVYQVSVGELGIYDLKLHKATISVLNYKHLLDSLISKYGEDSEGVSGSITYELDFFTHHSLTVF